MTGISGWQLDHADDDREVIARVGQHLQGAHDLLSRRCRTGTLAAKVTESSIFVDSASGLVAAIDGKPRWTQAGLAQTARIDGNGAALAAAYREHGAKLFNALTGTFSFAIIDPANSEAMIAIDRMGIRPMCFAVDQDGKFCFGSNARTILARRTVDAGLSRQALFHYIYFHVVPSPRTVYSSIQKLEPGQFGVFRNGSWELGFYWNPDLSRPGSVDSNALRAELMAEMRAAVAHTNPDSSTAAFLSGGLDSSTVCGLANELRDEPLPSYSIGFAQEGYDEIEYARIAARRFGLDLQEYYVTPEDIAEALPVIASQYDEPFGNASAVPAYFCARLAKRDGMTRLLAGDGGDELFAGNERYATQQLFDYYNKVPGIVRKYLLEPAARTLPTDWSKLTHKARRYIEQACVPMPERLQTYNFLHVNRPESIFTESFLSDIDVQGPVSDLSTWYERSDGADLVDRMLMLDWKITLADNDIRKVNQMCSAAQIAVEYPLLDDDLVKFSTRIPTRLKMRNRELRTFFKESTAGFLPDEIIHKKKHGFGLPFGEWLKTSDMLKDVVAPIMDRLKTRDIFQEQFIDGLIENHRNVHAAYYGNIIWVLVMLDCWLATHESQSGPEKM